MIFILSSRRAKSKIRTISRSLFPRLFQNVLTFIIKVLLGFFNHPLQEKIAWIQSLLYSVLSSHDYIYPYPAKCHTKGSIYVTSIYYRPAGWLAFPAHARASYARISCRGTLRSLPLTFTQGFVLLYLISNFQEDMINLLFSKLPFPKINFHTHKMCNPLK